MIESLHFVYDGIRSRDMNAIQISSNSGLFQEIFTASKRINEEKIRGRDEPYFFGVEREPISFPLSIWFDEGISDERKQEIKRWLDQDTYKPFYVEDYPHQIMYAICVDESSHIHNGIDMGYVTLNFRTNSSYRFSPVYIESYDFSENTSNGTEFTFVNRGDIECKPYLRIKMLENGDLKIINQSNSGLEFSFDNLNKDEIIEVDCIKEDIKSNVMNRFDNFNDNYMSFVRGHNYLKVYGKCVIDIKFQFKFK